MKEITADTKMTAQRILMRKSKVSFIRNITDGINKKGSLHVSLLSFSSFTD